MGSVASPRSLPDTFAHGRSRAIYRAGVGKGGRCEARSHPSAMNGAATPAPGGSKCVGESFTPDRPQGDRKGRPYHTRDESPGEARV